MTYLDYSATSPVDEEVMDSFVRACRYFGNPNSLHKLGVDAKRLIDASTLQIANILNISVGFNIFLKINVSNISKEITSFLSIS